TCSHRRQLHPTRASYTRNPSLLREGRPQMKTETRPASKGGGRIFSRKGSSFLWIGYSLDGQEFRESTHTADPDRAGKILRHRLKQVGAAQLRVADFISPRMERVRIKELLNALADDYKLRGKDSPQFRS